MERRYIGLLRYSPWLSGRDSVRHEQQRRTQHGFILNLVDELMQRNSAQKSSGAPTASTQEKLALQITKSA
jgi:hypothetical protein